VVLELQRVRGDRDPTASIESVRQAYVIVRIITSAHDGSITANVLDVSPAHPVQPPVSILVERGSHAMAPDVDDDGRVTPGTDVNASAKFLWGIRDHGDGGARYRSAYTDDRSAGVRLGRPDAAAAEHRCDADALESGEALQAWFSSTTLPAPVRDRIVGRTNWLFRWFGDVKVEDLLIPRDHDSSIVRSMTNRRADREGGISIRSRLGEQSGPLAIGGRWAWGTPGRLAPHPPTSREGLVDTHRISARTLRRPPLH